MVFSVKTGSLGSHLHNTKHRKVNVQGSPSELFCLLKKNITNYCCSNYLSNLAEFMLIKLFGAVLRANVENGHRQAISTLKLPH